MHYIQIRIQLFISVRFRFQVIGEYGSSTDPYPNRCDQLYLCLFSGVEMQNPFVTLEAEFATPYLIDKFIKSSPHYIAPQTVKLAPDSTGKAPSFQYVSIIELAKKVQGELSSLPASAHPPRLNEEENVILRDICDGDSYRNNCYFRQNPEALGIILASDEFDPCNAIGPSKGLHKTINVYATFVDIPKEHR